MSVRLWILAVVLGSGAVAGAEIVAVTSPTSAPVDADAVDFTTTTWVTVHLKNALPDVAAAAIAEQAGVPTRLVVSAPRPSTAPAPHDFDVDHQPFWLALMSLCDVYDLSEPGSRRGDGWSLTTRGIFDARMQPPRRPVPAWTKSPSAISGPFVVFAKNITRHRALDPVIENEDQPPKATDQFNLSLVICAEPRVTVLQRPFFPTFDTFVDDRGTQLAPEVSPDGLTPRLRAPDNEPWLMACNPRSPDPGATMITKMAGRVRLQVVKRSQTVELPDPGTGQTANVDLAGLRAVMTGFHDVPRIGYEADVAVYRDQMEPGAWTRRVTLLREGSNVRALDADAKLLPQFGRWQENPQTADSFTVHFRYGHATTRNGKQSAGPPVRLLWEVPVEAGEVEVPFEFDDLPLPAR